MKDSHQIKYRTNFKNCVIEAMRRRGWKECENTNDTDWDIIWAEKENLNDIYEQHLTANQKVNHYKNHYELCRKDLMIKNLKKY